LVPGAASTRTRTGRRDTAAAGIAWPDASSLDRSRMNAAPPYYLVGPAGHPHYGDALISAGSLHYLADTAPGAQVWVDTHSPGPAQVLLGDLQPRVRFTDTLCRLCWEAPSDDPWQVASWVRRAVDDPGLAPRWDRGIALLRRADVIHLLGGGYINRIWPRHIGLLAGATAAARASGARCAATGLGLFPEPDGAAELVRTTAAEFAAPSGPGNKPR